MEGNYKMKYLWCQVFLDRLEENISNIRKMDDKKIIAVVTKETMVVEC